MEATIPADSTEMALTYRSLAIAVSEEALKDKCPLVGVGLVYMPPYLPKVAFGQASMSGTLRRALTRLLMIGWWEPTYCLYRLLGRANSSWLRSSTPSCWIWPPLRWPVA